VADSLFFFFFFFLGYRRRRRRNILHVSARQHVRSEELSTLRQMMKVPNEMTAFPCQPHQQQQLWQPPDGQAGTRVPENAPVWSQESASGCDSGGTLHRCDHAASGFTMHLFTCAVVAHGESHFREGSTCGSAVSEVAKLRAACSV